VVGSSRRSNFGPWATAAARETSFFWPPLSLSTSS
jgi:hypothetical protein